MNTIHQVETPKAMLDYLKNNELDVQHHELKDKSTTQTLNMFPRLENNLLGYSFQLQYHKYVFQLLNIHQSD